MSSFESRLVILKDLQATNILDIANDTGLAALDAGDRLSCLTSMTANIHVFSFASTILPTTGGLSYKRTRGGTSLGSGPKAKLG